MAYVDMGISGSYSNPSSSVRGYIALFDEVDIQKAAREYVEKHLTSAISRIFSVGGASPFEVAGALGRFNEVIEGLSRGVRFEAEVPYGGIGVFFSDGSYYTYTRDRIGQGAVDTMMSLARGGAGLGSYIYRNVRFKYSTKG